MIASRQTSSKSTATVSYRSDHRTRLVPRKRAIVVDHPPRLALSRRGGNRGRDLGCDGKGRVVSVLPRAIAPVQFAHAACRRASEEETTCPVERHPTSPYPYTNAKIRSQPHATSWVPPVTSTKRCHLRVDPSRRDCEDGEVRVLKVERSRDEVNGVLSGVGSARTRHIHSRG
jgi:hypothetical protein